MHNVAVFVVFLSSTIATVFSDIDSVNYCGARMCGNTNSHTFCQYLPGPSPNCVGYISVEMSKEEKSRVIARLNRRRNEAAFGRLGALATAGNMLKLRWVEELAREAQRWADQCRPPSIPEEHDSCRDLYSVGVGQCVASVVGEAPGLRVESMVDIWYMQNMLYKGNVTMYIPPTGNNSYYGDFAQIMWAYSYMVGCARSRFMTPWQGRLRSVERLVCNIAPHGPAPLRPLWSPSAPATMCPSHSKQDKELLALCDILSDKKWNKKDKLDPKISREVHLLMQTVIDIENNVSMNYPRSLDEIYLTRLTIANMDKYNTTIVDTAQNKDVIEIIELKENNISKVFNTQDAPKSSSSPKPAVKGNTRKRVTFIGRPKPYNLAELTDIDYRTENYSSIEDLSQDQKDIYADYEFIETLEDILKTVNLSKSTVILNNTTVNVEVVTKRYSAPRRVVTKMYQNSSMLYEGPKGQINNKLIYKEVKGAIRSNGTAKNISDLKDTEEEYFEDPETVSALQEALDRVEHDMANEGSMERQQKVRRELREKQSSDDQLEKINEAPDPDTDKLNFEMPTSNMERNGSRDKGEMFNMVLKYMPYLKQYDGGLLNKANGCEHLLPTSFLVISFCIYFLRVIVFLDMFVAF